MNANARKKRWKPFLTSRRRKCRKFSKTYGLNETESASVVEALRQRPKDWVDFMMRFELGLEKPEPGRALKSAQTIALSYVVGGIIPLSAYLIFADVHRALNVSIAVTLARIAGFWRGQKAGSPTRRCSAADYQTTLIGGLAAAAAFAIARLIA